jgi:hypothetical protein
MCWIFVKVLSVAISLRKMCRVLTGDFLFSDGSTLNHEKNYQNTRKNIFEVEKSQKFVTDGIFGLNPKL